MEIKNLYFSYGPNDKNGAHDILKDVSFSIKEGKITTILGANGCGKSTLFQLMTKNLVPRKGKVYLKGKNIRVIRLKDFAKEVSIVHQYNTASNDTTVETLVSYGRTPYVRLGKKLDKEDQKYMDWAMEVTGITELRQREISTLSGGQKQRVWIAMALAQNTDILLLDEPTTYLDIRYQIEILKLIQKLNREYGITIVMILHDMNQAIHYSDEIIGLRQGKVHIMGEPAKVVTRKALQELYGVELDVVDLEKGKFVLAV